MEREGETEGRTEDQAGRLEAASADDGEGERSTPARSQTVVWTSDIPQRPGVLPQIFRRQSRRFGRAVEHMRNALRG